METRIELKQGWKILQDVHDTGEKIGLYAAREADTSVLHWWRWLQGYCRLFR